MDDKTKKKSIVDRAIDAVSNRDEKAAAEAAKLEAEKTKKAAAMRAKLVSDRAMADQKAKGAARIAEIKAAKEKADAAKNVKKYVIQEGETWSHMALKFYGHATPPYYQILIDANKATVGEDYRRIRAGMEIVIPELPEELKKK